MSHPLCIEVNKAMLDRHDKSHLIIKDLIVKDFEHKKWKKETIYMVTVLVIESLSIMQKPKDLQVVTTRHYIV